MGIEIKMGSKSESTGRGDLKPLTIHTGSMKPEPEIQISELGLKNVITEKKDIVKKIEIDNNMLIKLLEECAKDLMVERIIKVPSKYDGSGKMTLPFLTNYDARNRIFTFTKDVKFFNDCLNLDNSDLADFLSSFFFFNINKYCMNLYNAVPIILPVTSFEAQPNNRVTITLL